MTDIITLDHKRQMVRVKADRQREPWLIFTWDDDIEPKMLCDVPARLRSDGMEVVELIYPRAS